MTDFHPTTVNSTRPRTTAWVWGLMLAVLAGLGCSDGRSSFSHRDEFQKLAPFARDYLKEQLVTHFGSPTEPVAWEELPLRFHAAEGRVVRTSSGARGITTMTVSVTEEHLPVAAGQEVLFLSGPRLGEEPGRIEQFDPQTGLARFEHELGGPSPSEGDRVVFEPGHFLRRGRMLYAEHCQHCHGVSGDGHGPTAQYLNPLPRDYRMGVFKFTSTQSSNRATRDDLWRVIENGIPGTYMPSFKLLDPQEMEAIIEYVLFLSMRGELEWRMTQFLSIDYSRDVVNERIAAGESMEKIVEEFTKAIADDGEIGEEWTLRIELLSNAWSSSQADSALVFPGQPRVDPTADPESIARGRIIYLGADAKCASCHGDAGLGDGPQTLAIQPPDPLTGEEHELPGLYDSWGNPIQPRNLREGIYRGGRRPIDIYRRIHSSIKGTPMPAFGNSLNDQQIWDLVNYVMSMPYETYRPGEGADPPGTAEVRARMATEESPADAASEETESAAVHSSSGASDPELAGVTGPRE